MFKEPTGSQSYKVTPEILMIINSISSQIAKKVEHLGRISKDELFKELFSEPGFPSQPIVNENDRRDKFILAIAGLDKNLYKITGDEIIYVNPQS